VRWGDGEATLVQESDLCFLFFKGVAAAPFFLNKKDERVATTSLLERIGLGFFLFFFFFSEKLSPFLNIFLLFVYIVECSLI